MNLNIWRKRNNKKIIIKNQKKAFITLNKFSIFILNFNLLRNINKNIEIDKII